MLTSSLCDLLDLANLLSHLAGPIADSRDDGDGNGGAGRWRDTGESYGGSNKRYAEHLLTTRKLLRVLSWPGVVWLGGTTATEVAAELQ